MKTENELKKDHERLVIENIRLSNKITQLEKKNKKMQCCMNCRNVAFSYTEIYCDLGKSEECTTTSDYGTEDLWALDNDK